MDRCYGRVHSLVLYRLLKDILILTKIVSQVIKHRLLLLKELHLFLKHLNLLGEQLAVTFVYLVFELGSSKDLPRVHLEDLELLYDIRVGPFCAPHLLQLIIKT